MGDRSLRAERGNLTKGSPRRFAPRDDNQIKNLAPSGFTLPLFVVVFFLTPYVFFTFYLPPFTFHFSPSYSLST